MNELLPIFWTCLFTFLVNLPCGYYRAGYKKLSLWWFIFIHLPVPLVIYVRYYNHVELSWTLAPFLFGSYFLGQFIGTRWRLFRDLKKGEAVNKPSS